MKNGSRSHGQKNDKPIKGAVMKLNICRFPLRVPFLAEIAVVRFDAEKDSHAVNQLESFNDAGNDTVDVGYTPQDQLAQFQSLRSDSPIMHLMPNWQIPTNQSFREAA
jgi:hypothetical protein